MSPPWQKLTGKLNVMAMCQTGILDIEGWTTIEHAAARTWAAGPVDAAPPAKIAAYLARVEAIAAQADTAKGPTS